MASTLAADRLTEAHRLGQARLGAQTVSDMFAAFGLLDPDNLDSSFGRWLRVAIPLVERQHVASTKLAAGYLQAFRLMEIGSDPRFTPTIALFDSSAATTSLTVTGPVSIKRAMTRGLDLDKAVPNAQAASARAAMRHALAGGRDTIQQTIADDRRALGFRRVTSGSTCKFCEMLAGRGAVYKARTVNFEAHDGCACSSEPVYARR